MSFDDELTRDLENVFFEDYKHIAIINGVEVAGYFNAEPWRFLNVDASQKTFQFPSLEMTEPVNRGSVVSITVRGVLREFEFIRFLNDGDTKIMVLQ